MKPSCQTTWKILDGVHVILNLVVTDLSKMVAIPRCISQYQRELVYSLVVLVKD